MATIFEDMMTANRRAKKVNRLGEAKKISYKKLKVESVKVLHEGDYDELEKEFIADPEESEVVLVLDPEIPYEDEVPEDAAEKMIGDVVFKCPICGANYACDCKDPADVFVTDEEGIPTECPICGDEAEQIILGEIAPVESEGDADSSMRLQDNDHQEDESNEEDSEDETEEESLKKESINQAGRDLGKYQMWVDYDMEHYGHISEETKKFIKDAGLELVKDTNDQYEVVAKECMTEDVDDCTDCDEYEIVDAEAIPEEEDDAPVVEITDSDVKLVFDNEVLESMINRMIKECYHGNNTIKFTRCALNKKGQFCLEYKLREAKKITKGVLVGEGFNKTSQKITLTFKDRGVFTESLTKDPIFTVECIRKNSSVTPVSFKYDYRAKVNESMYRVKGLVKKSK